MKTKIKNIILIFVAFMFCMTTMNVSAANPTVDPNVCKDGKVYTNYYYFLLADTPNSITVGENQTEHDAVLSYVKNNWQPNTYMGLYRNNIIKPESLQNHGFYNLDSKYIVSGNVPLKNQDNLTTTINGMSYTTFYTNYVNSYQYRNEGLGSWTEGSSTVSHVVTHQWTKYESSGTGYIIHNEDDSLDLSGYARNIAALIKATISANSTIIPIYPDSSTLIDFKITRNYANATAPIGNDYERLQIGGNQWILVPSAYYIQYCEPAEEKTLTYDGNASGVTNVPAKQTYTTSTTVSSKEPVRSGYTFLGWNEDKNATRADSNFAAGKTYSGESTTIYAIWKKNETPVSTTFKIEYDANGGTNAPDTQNGTVGECLTISETIPKQSKNKFLGWSTNDKAPEPDKDENGNLKYEPGKSTYCGGSGDLKLYAVWQPISGVESHLLVFAIVALSAGTALIVTKRKGLFKQI